MICMYALSMLVITVHILDQIDLMLEVSCYQCWLQIRLCIIKPYHITSN